MYDKCETCNKLIVTRAIPAPMGVDEEKKSLVELFEPLRGLDINLDRKQETTRTPDARIVEAKGIIRDLLNLMVGIKGGRFTLETKDRAYKWLKEMGE